MYRIDIYISCFYATDSGAHESVVTSLGTDNIDTLIDQLHRHDIQINPNITTLD